METSPNVNVTLGMGGIHPMMVVAMNHGVITRAVLVKFALELTDVQQLRILS